jgi:hypothetical protein
LLLVHEDPRSVDSIPKESVAYSHVSPYEGSSLVVVAFRIHHFFL